MCIYKLMTEFSKFIYETCNFRQQRKLDDIEKLVSELMEKIITLLKKLDVLENVKKY